MDSVIRIPFKADVLDGSEKYFQNSSCEIVVAERFPSLKSNEQRLGEHCALILEKPTETNSYHKWWLVTAVPDAEKLRHQVTADWRSPQEVNYWLTGGGLANRRRRLNDLQSSSLDSQPITIENSSQKYDRLWERKRATDPRLSLVDRVSINMHSTLDDASWSILAAYVPVAVRVKPFALTNDDHLKHDVDLLVYKHAVALFQANEIACASYVMEVFTALSTASVVVEDNGHADLARRMREASIAVVHASNSDLNLKDLLTFRIQLPSGQWLNQLIEGVLSDVKAIRDALEELPSNIENTSRELPTDDLAQLLVAAMLWKPQPTSNQLLAKLLLATFPTVTFKKEIAEEPGQPERFGMLCKLHNLTVTEPELLVGYILKKGHIEPPWDLVRRFIYAAFAVKYSKVEINTSINKFASTNKLTAGFNTKRSGANEELERVTEAFERHYSRENLLEKAKN